MESRVSDEPLLSVRNLSKIFFMHEQDIHIRSCFKVSFDLMEGDFLSIVGESGAGKSTVLKCLIRNYLPTEGEILYRYKDGRVIDLAKASDREIIRLKQGEIGSVSQFLRILPRITAYEFVRDAALHTGSTEEEAGRMAEEMLRYFRIPDNLWELYPMTFSGGEKLRLNLAHAMVMRPRLLLLDEPTASLDMDSKKLVRELILQLKEEGTTMIGIFHDLEFMDQVSDQVIRLVAGSVEEEKDYTSAEALLRA